MTGSPDARLARSPGPAIERVHHSGLVLVPCDASASTIEIAQVHLARDKATLSLCGHHFGQHETALLAAGWKVTSDTRGQLT